MASDHLLICTSYSYLSWAIFAAWSWKYCKWRGSILYFSFVSWLGSLKFNEFNGPFLSSLAFFWVSGLHCSPVLDYFVSVLSWFSFGKSGCTEVWNRDEENSGFYFIDWNLGLLKLVVSTDEPPKSLIIWCDESNLPIEEALCFESGLVSLPSSMFRNSRGFSRTRTDACRRKLFPVSVKMQLPPPELFYLKSLPVHYVDLLIDIWFFLSIFLMRLFPYLTEMWSVSAIGSNSGAKKREGFFDCFSWNDSRCFE
jgi:hypothetical protein